MNLFKRKTRQPASKPAPEPQQSSPYTIKYYDPARPGVVMECIAGAKVLDSALTQLRDLGFVIDSCTNL